MLGLPFGGYKQSGIGRKLAFEETMREFTRVKGIRFGTDPDVGL
jgi:acyl-CoA reductase-like NAD-dependent aldehyde dehydrogenase